MTDQELLNLAAECGFTHVNMLNVSALEFRSEVRDMCAADKCAHSGRCQACCRLAVRFDDLSASYYIYSLIR